MVITAVAIGTRGDVEPLVELGKEMLQRGHSFRILTHESFRPMVENGGSTFLRINVDADHVMKYLVTDYKTSLDFAIGMFKLKKEDPSFMDETIAAIKGSDLVIYGTCSAFAYHAAEYLGIPCARVFYSPMDPTSQYSLYCDEFDSEKVRKSYDGLPEGMNLMTMLALNKWRREHGLKRWKLNSTYKEMNGKKLLTFYPTSRTLMRPDPNWGDHIHVTGYWYHPDQAGKEYRAPEDLEEYLAGGERPIFVAFGKAESPELAELQRIVLKALKETGLRAIIQAEQLDEADKVNSDQLYFIGKVPYAYIFDRVRAVVHHGGNTTNGLGLRTGLPTLVIALALDQYFYGRSDHHIGAGPEPLYIRRKLCTVEEVKRALAELISGKYDEGAKQTGIAIAQEDGVAEAADAIEGYIG
ncbi:MAG: glycosyltransferase family 1 protein [Oscillospiraceae bacterium]|nr:glycosyltransferase family 1 protein [Oscillospiraceae bacterium]